MNVAEIRRQIDRVHRDAAALADERATAQAALDENLRRVAPSGPFSFNSSLARTQRAELARLDQHAVDLTARLAALEAQLPTPTALADAERAVAAQRSVIDGLQIDHDAALTAFLVALDVAEQAARTFDARRREVRTAIHGLADLVATTGLSAAVVPPVPVVGRALVQLTYLQGLLIGGAAAGDLDPQVVKELAAAVEAVTPAVDPALVAS